MFKIPYDASRASLYHPGEASNFFHCFDTGKDIPEAALCAEMARLAYVKEKIRLQDYLSRARFQLYWLVGYTEGRGTQLFLATDKTNTNPPKRAVVAFRGTEPDDPADIAADAGFLLTPWFDANHKPLGEVHSGFADALLNDANNGNILAQLKDQLLALLKTYPGIEIYLTGHSLGAALATLTASCMASMPISNFHLYTFGSPRVGDSEFAKQIPADKHDRYVNCCDLITRVPVPVGSLDYAHNGSLRYIDRFGQLAASVQSEDDISDRSAAAADFVNTYSFLPKTVWVREMADHSPINYVSGVAGLRS